MRLLLYILVKSLEFAAPLDASDLYQRTGVNNLIYHITSIGLDKLS
jgi:hypothetical protein